MIRLPHNLSKSSRQHAVALLGAVLALAGVAAVYAAAPQDFALSSLPESQTIDDGGTARFVVSVSPSGGFTGAVTLTAANLPQRAMARWSSGTAGGCPKSGPTCRPRTTLPAGPGKRYAVLTVTTARSMATRAGSQRHHLSVAASSGRLRHTTKMLVAMQRAPAPAFGLSVDPLSQSVAQGGTVDSKVTVSRTKWSGAVRLGPVAGLPPGASAALDPTTVAGRSGRSTSGLSIKTSATTPTGTYVLVLRATSAAGRKETRARRPLRQRGRDKATTRYAAFILNVGSAARDFPISGDLAVPLTLGVSGSQPVDLSITNPYGSALVVSNLQVRITALQQAAGASGGCSIGGALNDFQINQVDPGARVTVPASSTKRLSELGAAMPMVSWVDRPWRQNGCLGARLSFSYSANGDQP